MKQEGYVKHDEAHFFCPKHSARSDRTIGQLSINLKTDMFHCWSCEWKGRNLVPILRLKPGPELSEYTQEWAEAHHALDVPLQKEYKVPELPQSFKSLSVEHQDVYYGRCTGYLRSRGVEHEDIVRMKLGYCEETGYWNRVIFPSFDEHGSLNFFVGRAIGGSSRLKYRTEDSYNKDIIFNDYLIDWRKPIILTEGPFDALKARDNAIPIQGLRCRPRTKLFHKIVEKGVQVYFAMDADVVQKQLDLISVFMDYDVRSFVVPLAGRKDVGEMTHGEFQERLAQASPIQSDLDLLRMRVRA